MLNEAILIGLSSWRVAALLSGERGPFDIFLKFRSVLGFKHDDIGKPISWPDGFFSTLFSCIWCLSIWISAGMWGVWQFSEPVVIVIAASSILLAVERWNNA